MHNLSVKPGLSVKTGVRGLNPGEVKGSLTVWALYAYFSDSQNAAFGLLVWYM